MNNNNNNNTYNNNECLICKAKLIYLNQDELMECEICHKKELSKTKCINNHYICNDCHMKGLDQIISLCLNETSINPFIILNKMMNLSFCHMHGPEHHILVGASLLTAYKNAGGNIDLNKALNEIILRGKTIPGGFCGFYGACGAGISSGIYISIITQATPLSKEEWGLANKMTSKSLNAIGEVGGPRCCKRDSYLAILSAIDFTEEYFHIKLEKDHIICNYSSKNNQCIGSRCPFNITNNNITNK